MTIQWTDEMVTKLRELRAVGTPLYWCAFDLGVSYKTAVHKARELGLAERMSRGRKTGIKVALDKVKAYLNKEGTDD